MATIRRHRAADGTTSYLVRVRLRGFPPQTASFRRLTDAKQWGDATETALRERRFFPTREAQRRTVSDLLTKFRKQIETDPAKVAAGQVSQIEWWRAEVGHLRLSDLTPAVISECREKLAQGKSGPTANRYLAALSRALTLAAKEWGWIEHNPMSRVARKPEHPGRVRFLSDDVRDGAGRAIEKGERTRLLEACRQSDLPALYPIVVLALSTGARQGEILSLTWGQVDLQRGWVTLEHTKNKDRRGLPLTGHALTVMKEWAGDGKVRHLPTASVFPGLKAASGHFRRAWTAAIKAADLRDFRFHDLRHSAASALIMSGASLGEIADVLGHRTLAMVRRYAHIADEHRAHVVARMNAGLFSEGKP